MRKKIALLLSAVMVITSIPQSGMAVFASEEETTVLETDVAAETTAILEAEPEIIETVTEAVENELVAGEAEAVPVEPESEVS
ncbi:MAG: hypothetical protein Q4F41_09920, partial [Eubacteriales bacterium]|nr:hypothetical protein [Eubacteriales bacterium]